MIKSKKIEIRPQNGVINNSKKYGLNFGQKKILNCINLIEIKQNKMKLKNHQSNEINNILITGMWFCWI